MTERTRVRRLERLTLTGFVKHDPKMCAAGMREAAKALLDFQSLSMDARSLFKEVNDAAIRERAAGISAGTSGAAYQKAFGEMWREADKAYWNAELSKRINVYE